MYIYKYVKRNINNIQKYSKIVAKRATLHFRPIETLTIRVLSDQTNQFSHPFSGRRAILDNGIGHRNQIVNQIRRFRSSLTTAQSQTKLHSHIVERQLSILSPYKTFYQSLRKDRHSSVEIREKIRSNPKNRRPHKWPIIYSCLFFRLWSL